MQNWEQRRCEVADAKQWAMLTSQSAALGGAFMERMAFEFQALRLKVMRLADRVGTPEEERTSY